MELINELFSNGWKGILLQIKGIDVGDIIDIILVAVLFYYVYVFIKDRRASKLALGITLIIVVLALSELANLTVLQYLLQNLYQIGILAIVIIFQPELRSMLESVVGEAGRGLRSIGDRKGEAEKEIFLRELTEAASLLSASSTGALIVLEGSSKLGDVTSNGTILDAECSSLLLRNIFYNKAPLHDGAVIIRDMKIHAAGCTLPLTAKNNTVAKELGTRHRAALGITEQSDALAIVVSEETGTVSVAYKGVMKRDYDSITLRNVINEVYLSSYGNTKKGESRKGAKSTRKKRRDDEDKTEDAVKEVSVK